MKSLFKHYLYPGDVDGGILSMELKPEAINWKAIFKDYQPSWLKIFGAFIDVYGIYDTLDTKNLEPKMEVTIHIYFDPAYEVNLKGILEDHPLINRYAIRPVLPTIGPTTTSEDGLDMAHFTIALDIDLAMLFMSQVSWMLNTETKND